MARNYRSLARPYKAGPCVFIGLISTVGLMVLAFLVPENFPNLVLPLLSIAAMQLWFQGTQEAEYKKHVDTGGPKASSGPVIFVGVSCLVGILLVIFAVVLVGSGGVLFDNYGQRLEFNAGELYYTSEVTEEEARSLGRYLVSADFFDNTPRSAQITRSGAVYGFRFIVATGDVQRDILLEIAAAQLANELSANVFNNAPVEIHICDESFQTLKRIPGSAHAGISVDRRDSPPQATTEPARKSAPVLPAPGIYVVRSGDTLSDIARKHDVTVEALQSLNGITDPDKIGVGMPLRIPTRPNRD
ncbi:MAG: LysM peptidoglycan-binding domain-containing protein [Phycisphaerae bacterium]|nr:LysM peptidoglycan-binding domain-containing protein [Phycisphaerae bacterium]